MTTVAKGVQEEGHTALAATAMDGCARRLPAIQVCGKVVTLEGWRGSVRPKSLSKQWEGDFHTSICGSEKIATGFEGVLMEIPSSVEFARRPPPHSISQLLRGLPGKLGLELFDLGRGIRNGIGRPI